MTGRSRIGLIGGRLGCAAFSPLTQITKTNVADLEVAWTHQSGDFFDGSGSSKVTALQVTPLVVNDKLYYCTPSCAFFRLMLRPARRMALRC